MVLNSFNHFLQPFKRAFVTNWPFKMFYDVLVYGWHWERRSYWWPVKQTHRDHTAYGLEKETLSRILLRWAIITGFKFFSFFIVAFYFSNLWLVFNAKKSSEPFFIFLFCFFAWSSHAIFILTQKSSMNFQWNCFFAPVKIKEISTIFLHFPFTTFFRWSSLAVFGLQQETKETMKALIKRLYSSRIEYHYTRLWKKLWNSWFVGMQRRNV